MSRPNSRQSLLKDRKFLVLDGGLGTELERRGCHLDTHLWSADILARTPEQIKAVHLDYLRAGADVITTSTYQLSFEGGMRAGWNDYEVNELFHRAISLARQAIETYVAEKKGVTRQPLIAASIGPYGACLADGSEYTGLYPCSPSSLFEFHTRRMAHILQMKPDVLLCETIPSLEEAAILMRILAEYGHIECWLSVNCKDEHHLADGSTINELVLLCRQTSHIQVLGVNCVAAELVEPVITNIKKAGWRRGLMAYPNSGETYDGNKKEWTGSTDAGNIDSLVRTWYDLGLRIIGGCCRTGPDEIRAIRQILSAIDPVR